ncbi:hypothetical protein GLOIN_2v1780326 [Rhizophagus irregularis DAOM 181602=DAOM 197198]|nr:hypothetical protein GLOIN_2v1780326 [Rhizophagus irregularis DAOM 181602=DAOM 197198]
MPALITAIRADSISRYVGLAGIAWVDIFILCKVFFNLTYLYLIKMIGEYTCEYLHNTGKPCGRPCMRPEGCHIYWKTKSRFPCAVCGKPTGSSSGRCQSHIGSYYQNRYEKRLRQRIRAIYD